MADKPPLIASQRMLLLDQSVQNPRDFLRPGRYRTVRPQVNSACVPSDALARSGSTPEVVEIVDCKEVEFVGNWRDDASSDTSPWCPVHFRDLFVDSSIRRLGLASEAGMGKSTALQRAQDEIMQADPRVLAIYARLGDLPETAADYLRLPETAGRPPNTLAGDLVRIMCEDLGRAGTGCPQTERTIERLKRDGDALLYRLARDGRLVLLVDALDQIRRSASHDAPPQIGALRDFLAGDGRKCRVVIAGRPSTLDEFWGDLFEGADWRLARIEDFSAEEKRKYLGSERFKLMYRLSGGVELLASPRALEAIRSLDVERLHELRTASYIYWQCIDSVLAKATVPDLTHRRFRDETVLWLLGALAFQMVLEGNFYGVTEGEYYKFIGRVWGRQQRNCRFGDFREFEDALELLGRTNEFLEHGFLEGRGMKQVFWRNRTLQEFFAGLWLARFTTTESL